MSSVVPTRGSRRLLTLVGAAVSAWLVFFPAKQLAAEKVRIAHLSERLETTERDNARLRAEVARLEDAGQLELMARDRLGWVRPGERAYITVVEPAPSPTPAPARESWGSSLLDRLSRLVRGRG